MARIKYATRFYEILRPRQRNRVRDRRPLCFSRSRYYNRQKIYKSNDSVNREFDENWRKEREREREKETFVEIERSLSPLIANGGMDRKMITEWPDTGKNKRERGRWIRGNSSWLKYRGNADCLYYRQRSNKRDVDQPPCIYPRERFISSRFCLRFPSRVDHRRDNNYAILHADTSIITISGRRGKPIEDFELDILSKFYRIVRHPTSIITILRSKSSN